MEIAIRNLQDLYEHMSGCIGYDGNGHWLSKEPMEPQGSHGFTYCVRNNTNGKLYVGKKNFHVGGKKTHIVNSKRVENRSHGAATNWKTYTTSSIALNADLKELGDEMFDFIHLRSFKTKGGLSYSEVNTQHILHCLTHKMDNGEDRLFYNGQIGAIRFIPKEL